MLRWSAVLIQTKAWHATKITLKACIVEQHGGEVRRFHCYALALIISLAGMGVLVAILALISYLVLTFGFGKFMVGLAGVFVVWTTIALGERLTLMMKLK